MFWLTLIYFYNTWQGSSEAERKAGESCRNSFQLPNPTPKIRVGTPGGEQGCAGVDVDPPGASHPARLQLHGMS